MPKSLDVLLYWSLAALAAACSPSPIESDFDAPVAIPVQADWLDCGVAFEAGPRGDWDHHLWGGFAASAVKKDGRVHLYYQGARGYDESEATVTRRAIGLATSHDGVVFTRHEANPVLEWAPNDQLEEGAVSAAAFARETGEVVVHFGANTWAGGSEVNADGRIAVSDDGVHFTDRGVVLDRTDPALWGSGDEIFPVAGVEAGDRWYLYYIPNGVPEEGHLGVAWGRLEGELEGSAGVRSGAPDVSAWGPASLVDLDDGDYALFLNDVYAPGGPRLDVHLLSLDDPAQVGPPVRSYRFDEAWEAVVLLDRDVDTWFMYYRSRDHSHYGVKVARAGGTVTCPGDSGPVAAGGP